MGRYPQNSRSFQSQTTNFVLFFFVYSTTIAISYLFLSNTGKKNLFFYDLDCLIACSS